MCVSVAAVLYISINLASFTSGCKFILPVPLIVFVTIKEELIICSPVNVLLPVVANEDVSIVEPVKLVAYTLPLTNKSFLITALSSYTNNSGLL